MSLAAGTPLVAAILNPDLARRRKTGQRVFESADVALQSDGQYKTGRELLYDNLKQTARQGLVSEVKPQGRGDSRRGDTPADLLGKRFESRLADSKASSPGQRCISSRKVAKAMRSR